jgi:hypothetical protein
MYARQSLQPSDTHQPQAIFTRGLLTSDNPLSQAFGVPKGHRMPLRQVCVLDVAATLYPNQRDLGLRGHQVKLNWCLPAGMIP